MNEGEEVRKGKSVFRSVILLMAVVFAVMAGNTGIYAAQVEEGPQASGYDPDPRKVQ